ncbi:MAG: signal recognition particle-docking protein FtsY, partial [Candidatus Zixiibacteriota bacterium]
MLATFEKLRASLAKTKKGLIDRLSAVVGKRRIDADLLDDIEEILIEADIGVEATTHLIDTITEAARARKMTEGDEVIALLKDEMAAMLSRHPAGSAGTARKPEIWLITGVNGVGKTTTIGKLAVRFAGDGRKVLIAACDTFRAAAIDQVAVWAERSSVGIIRSQEGADPAAVAFDAASAAVARGADILLVDTAGRLHTKTNLMEELKKIKRVVHKAAPEATVLSKLIIDGTTGQNALSQAKVFAEAVGCDGIIITKLDGTARGGMV